MQCWKCNGTGVLPQYKHIDNGKCYPCYGTGKITPIEYWGLNEESFKKAMGGKTKELFNVDERRLDAGQRKQFSEKLEEVRKQNELDPLPRGNEQRNLKAQLEEKTGKKITGTRLDAQPEISPERLTKLGITKKDGEYFSKSGTKIVNTFGLADIDPDDMQKPIGSRELKEKQSSDSEIDKFAGDKVVAQAVKDVRDFAMNHMQTEHGALLENVAIGSFQFSALNRPNIGGFYLLGDESVQMNIEVIATMVNKIHAKHGTSGEGYEKAMSVLRKQTTSTLFHEVSHAYHRQHLSQMDITAFDKAHAQARPSDAIAKRSRALLEKVAKETGYRPDVLETAYKRSDLPKETILHMKKHYAFLYGALNHKEYFATFAQTLAFSTGAAKVKERFPEDYDLLKTLFEGVIPL